MDLWIRNRDKTILQKVDNLLISDGMNEKKTFNIYTNNINVQNVLGEYATKERALEVLDEIQSLLQPKGMIKFDSILSKKDIKEFKSSIEPLYNIPVVYEMPKE